MSEPKRHITEFSPGAAGHSAYNTRDNKYIISENRYFTAIEEKLKNGFPNNDDPYAIVSCPSISLEESGKTTIRVEVSGKANSPLLWNVNNAITTALTRHLGFNFINEIESVPGSKQTYLSMPEGIPSQQVQRLEKEATKLVGRVARIIDSKVSKGEAKNGFIPTEEIDAELSRQNGRG